MFFFNINTSVKPGAALNTYSILIGKSDSLLHILQVEAMLFLIISKAYRHAKPQSRKNSFRFTDRINRMIRIFLNRLRRTYPADPVNPVKTNKICAHLRSSVSIRGQIISSRASAHEVCVYLRGSVADKFLCAFACWSVAEIYPPLEDPAASGETIRPSPDPPCLYEHQNVHPAQKHVHQNMILF